MLLETITGPCRRLKQSAAAICAEHRLHFETLNYGSLNSNIYHEIILAGTLLYLILGKGIILNAGHLLQFPPFQNATHHVEMVARL